MKLARKETAPSNIGLKGAMRRFRVIDGRRPLVLPEHRKEGVKIAVDLVDDVVIYKNFRLHPTRGWRDA